MSANIADLAARINIFLILLAHFEVGQLMPWASYLAFSVPWSPILRVLALALAFLLSSICKFAQQRLRGSCTEREKEPNSVRKPTSCDPSEGQKPFWTALHFFSSDTTSLLLLPSFLHAVLQRSSKSQKQPTTDKIPKCRCWLPPAQV